VAPTTLAAAYRALTVAQAQIVLLPSTLLPSSAGRGRGLRTGYLITVRRRVQGSHCSTGTDLSAAQHTAAFCWSGSWTTGYLISVRSTYVCLPPDLSLRLNFQRYSVHSLVLRRELSADRSAQPSQQSITLDRILLLSEEDNAAWPTMDVEEVPVVRSKWHVLVSSYR